MESSTPIFNLLDLPSKWIVEIVKKQTPKNIPLFASTCQSMYRIVKDSRNTYIKTLDYSKVFNGKEKNILTNHHCVYTKIHFENFVTEQEMREMVVQLIRNRVFSKAILISKNGHVVKEIFDLKPMSLQCWQFDLTFLPDYKMEKLCIAVALEHAENYALQLLSHVESVCIKISQCRNVLQQFDITDMTARIASKMPAKGCKLRIADSYIRFNPNRFKTSYNAPYVEFDYEDSYFYPNRCQIRAAFYPAPRGAIVVLFDDYLGKSGMLTMKHCSSVSEHDHFVKTSLNGCGPKHYNFKSWFPQQLLTTVFG